MRFLKRLLLTSLAAQLRLEAWLQQATLKASTPSPTQPPSTVTSSCSPTPEPTSPTAKESERCSPAQQRLTSTYLSLLTSASKQSWPRNLCTWSVNDNDVFGYQERWAEYRYNPSQITGLFKPTTTGNIAYWHSAQQFATLQD